jgi:hypothetical protein
MLIKTTLSAIPVYISICLSLPAWVYKAFRKIMTGFLWTGIEEVQQGKCLVAWPLVHRPVQLGGLGVLDLQRLGMALQLRWLSLERIDRDRPWAAIKVPVDAQSRAIFNTSIHCTVGNGLPTLFWVDPWIHGRSMADIVLELFAVAHAHRSQIRSRTSHRR